MTTDDLNNWVRQANWSMISEYSVAWVAAESKYGWELALEWIESGKENIASAGWSTLSNVVALQPDHQLDLPHLEKLLNKIETEIHSAENRVRYTMNVFIISAGSYVTALSEKAKNTAKKIGVVMVDVGNTACKVPDAVSYIDKVIQKGSLGKKKKEARC